MTDINHNYGNDTGNGNQSDSSEDALTTELGRVERHLYRLRKRREEILEELGQGKMDSGGRR